MFQGIHKTDSQSLGMFPVLYLRTKWTNTYRKGSQKHNYICNIQGVSVYTNLSQIRVHVSASSN